MLPSAVSLSCSDGADPQSACVRAWRGLLAGVLASLFALVAGPLRGQNTQMEFGKNRVQYIEFDWYSYVTEDYDVYFYTGGKELAQQVVTMADEEMDYVEQLVDYRLGERMKYIVYNTYSDFKQTNIGVKLEEDVNVGGYTPFIGNRAFVYFDGNHEHFREALRRSTAAVVVNDMIYGGSIQERLQNSALLNLPTWYMQGLIYYIGEDWNATHHERLRRGILDGEFEYFNALSNKESVLVGHSLWKYIAERYGKESIANILYITRVNKNMESGFLFVLGMDFETLQEQWLRYHKELYEKESGSFAELPPEMEPRPKWRFRKRRLTQARLSPSGKYAAFVTNYQGKFKVWLYDIERRRKKKLLREGYRQDNIEYDESYPILEWKPNEDVLTVIYEKRAQPHFFNYDAREKETLEERRIFRMDKVLSFDYHPNGRTIVLSGIRRGQSDIYSYDFRTNIMRPLTNDLYDDLEPRFIEGAKGVVFASNRPNDSVDFRNRKPSGAFAANMDLFHLDWTFRGFTEELHRVTHTPSVGERAPRMYNRAYFAYKTSENGVLNLNYARHDSLFSKTEVVLYYRDSLIYPNDTFRFSTPDVSQVQYSLDSARRRALYKGDTTVYYRDTFYHHQWTNYGRNLQLYDLQPKQKQFLSVHYQEEENHIGLQRYPASLQGRQTPRPMSRSYALMTQDEVQRSGDRKPLSKEEPVEVALEDSLEATPEAPSSKPDESDSLEVFFLGPYEWDYQPDTAEAAASQPDGDPNLAQAQRRRFGSSRPYFLEFTPDYLVTQVDFGVLNTPYKPLDGSLNFPRQNSLNGMFKLSISDLFQDYRLMGGVRLPVNFEGLDLFVSYHNLRKRLDKELIYFRQSNTEFGEDAVSTRVRNHELRYYMTYPFSEISAIKGGPFIRLDQYIGRVTTNATFSSASRTNIYWGGAHLEYVFDNTIPRGLNLYNGLRFKVYLDYFQDITYSSVAAANRTTERSIPEDGLQLTVLGADFRHYQKVHRQIIWANRLAGARSFGDQDVLFIMGGVDRWFLNQRTNNDLQPDPDLDFMFKAQTTNLRGFPQNARNGDAFALWNSELRIPLFQYLYRRPLNSTFINDFQLIAFGDIGTAWTGPSPYSDQNSFNRTTRQEKVPISYELISLRNPIAIGYGGGVRTSLLGYFVRADYAWGIEDGARTEPIFYLSLGTDF